VKLITRSCIQRSACKKIVVRSHNRGVQQSKAVQTIQWKLSETRTVFYSKISQAKYGYSTVLKSAVFKNAYLIRAVLY